MLALEAHYCSGYGTMGRDAYLGEGTIVPKVAFVGEAIADISELALLDVLLNRVEELILGDLVTFD